MTHKSAIMALFFLVGGIASSQAQDLNEKEVPQAVKTAFSKAYPKAIDTEWELKGANYEVDFDLARQDHKATYTSAGKLVSIEKDLPKKQLPANIARRIKTKYPKGIIEDVNWINTGGKITYKIDLEGTPDVNVWYKSDGMFIREVAD